MLHSILFDWYPTENEWERNFELFCLYKIINGDTYEPRSYVTKKGVKIGEWVYILHTRIKNKFL